MLQVVLAVLGLTLAWTTFRIGHDASFRREIAAARGLLTRCARVWWKRALSERAFAAVDVIAWGGLLTVRTLALA